MSAPAERLDALRDEMRACRDPQVRLARIVERARRREPLPEALRLDAYRVSGCQVRVWWVPEIDDGRCRFLTDSDALTLKAMAGLIGDLCTGGTPAEVAAFDFGFLDELGLMRQFAESRAATVRRIVEMTRAFAESRR